MRNGKTKSSSTTSSEVWSINGGILLAKSIACSFMALTATKEQLLFGKGGLSQPIVARRGSPGDFANSVRWFLIQSSTVVLVREHLHSSAAKVVLRHQRS